MFGLWAVSMSPSRDLAAVSFHRPQYAAAEATAAPAAGAIATTRVVIATKDLHKKRE